jgi:hypothetical protein
LDLKMPLENGSADERVSRGQASERAVCVCEVVSVERGARRPPLPAAVVCPPGGRRRRRLAITAVLYEGDPENAYAPTFLKGQQILFQDSDAILAIVISSDNQNETRGGRMIQGARRGHRGSVSSQERCGGHSRSMVFFLDWLYYENKLVLSSVILSFATSVPHISRSYLQISV